MKIEFDSEHIYNKLMFPTEDSITEVGQFLIRKLSEEEDWKKSDGDKLEKKIKRVKYEGQELTLTDPIRKLNSIFEREGNDYSVSLTGWLSDKEIRDRISLKKLDLNLKHAYGDTYVSMGEIGNGYLVRNGSTFASLSRDHNVFRINLGRGGCEKRELGEYDIFDTDLNLMGILVEKVINSYIDSYEYEGKVEVPKELKLIIR